MESEEPKLPAVRSIVWLDGWREVIVAVAQED
jgi:ribosome modulation factor